MESKEIIALISALFGGTIVALINYVLTKKRSAAEIDKIKAETKETLLKAEILEADVRSLRSAQQQQDGAIEELETFKKDMLEKLLAFSMAGFIYGHLQTLYFAKRNQKPMIYDHIGQTVRREIQFLTDNGYIKHVSQDELRAETDLSQRLDLTPAGEWYVELREAMEGRPIPKKTS